jgi:aspartyl aminopeptidase
LKINAN